MPATIKTSIPSTRRRPANFQEFNTKQASRGLAPVNKRIALLGCKLTAGPAAVEKPYQVFSEKDGDDLFGAGSELAIMIRAAFKAARALGAAPEIYGVGIAEPGAGTVATKTITITGPATASGDAEIRICGRTIRCAVTNADTATTIGNALKAAIDAFQNVEPLMVTAGAAAGVVTLTARHKGVNGNDVKVEWVSAPTGVTAVVAAGVTAASSYDITAALDSLVGKTYHGVAIANHLAADITDLKAHIANVGDPGMKRWTTCFMAEPGSVGTATTLGTTSNQMEIQIAGYENAPNLPGEITAMLACANWAIDDPAANFDGLELPLYPVSVTDAFTNTEIETLLAAGVTPLIPTEEGDATRIVRSVTTKTTENSVPFEALLDLSNVKSMFYVGTQMDIALTLAFQGLDAKMVEGTDRRVKTVAYDVLKKCEELGVVRDVDAHAKEIRVETDAVVTTRYNVAYPLAIVPNLHQIAAVGNLIVG